VGWRGTLVLAVALFASAVWLYREIVAEKGELSLDSVLRGPHDVPPAERITHLLSFDPATVTALRLQRGGQEWRVERRDGTWHGVAQPSDVDDFITSLLELAEIMPLDVAPQELADHGLDPPQAVVEVERGALPPIVLFLGLRNPPATGVYAELGPGGRVVLTGALALWEFDKAVRVLSPTAVGS